MSKINILDSSIYNLIAAGEVVERPLSIVKELIENSIDAGATRVSVELGQGLSSIAVIDDGYGMSKDDLPRAFLPHATSKVRTIEDLEKIGTLGFRGEALASIAAVAHVEATTRVSEAELGARIIIENGLVLELEEVGSPYGTSVVVKDIFKNIPARAKFLSRPKVEEGEIIALVSKLILSNPNIGIRLSISGKNIYHSDGLGLKSAVIAVYGHRALGQMIEFSGTMSDIVPESNVKNPINTHQNIAISGVLGHPSYYRPSKGYGTFVINGRFVRSTQLETAMLEAYAPYLMKHRFPVYVVSVDIPLSLVDVNVHPNKTEVRFAGSVDIGDFLYKLVSKEISCAATRMSAGDTDSAPVAAAVVEHISLPNQCAERDAGGDVSAVVIGDAKVQGKGYKDCVEYLDTVVLDKAKGPIFAAFESPRFFDIDLDTAPSDTPSKEPAGIAADSAPPTANSMRNSGFEPCRVLTRLYGTYIVVECEGAVYLIDQHAAHERLIFDRYIEEYKTQSVVMQELLLPYTFSVSISQSVRIMASIESIRATGIAIEEWSDCSFRITAVPQVLARCSLDRLAAMLIESLSKGSQKLIEERLISASCKAAVKAEDDLSEVEIFALLRDIDLKSPALFCPHGRPIIVRLTKQDLEKRFGR